MVGQMNRQSETLNILFSVFDQDSNKIYFINKMQQFHIYFKSYHYLLIWKKTRYLLSICKLCNLFVEHHKISINKATLYYLLKQEPTKGGKAGLQSI